MAGCKGFGWAKAWSVCHCIWVEGRDAAVMARDLLLILSINRVALQNQGLWLLLVDPLLFLPLMLLYILLVQPHVLPGLLHPLTTAVEPE